AKQCAKADRGDNCIVYKQFSPPLKMLDNHWVPESNHQPGPND
ncbi:unnamed protein product, partial [Staurois parvus]